MDLIAELELGARRSDTEPATAEEIWNELVQTALDWELLGEYSQW